MAQDTAIEIPKGTLKVKGNKVSYGLTPTLTWSVQKPQVAREVIEVNNLASLTIRRDSTIKVEAIGIGLSERNDQSRATIYVNGSPTLFYLGSQNNIYSVTDWFWKPTGKYANYSASDDDLKRYIKHNLSTTRPTNTNDKYGVPVDFVGIPEENKILEVSAGDSVNIITEFWGSKYHRADSTEAGQTQMISFFDGDLIPTTRTSDSGQQDLVEMLDNGYIEKIGTNIYKAVLKPNQMITMVDYRKTAVDINDMVYMVEVTGRDTLEDDANYDYYLVKVDRTQRFVQYDVNGDPVIPEDEDGNIAIDPGSDTFGFDEIHLIDGSEPVDSNNPSKFTYKFDTPNGVYGSDYKLIAIYRGSGIAGGGSTSTPGNISDEEKEYELATAFLDSNGIIYEFEITNLKDPNSRIMGDSSGEIAGFNPEPIIKYTFNAKRKVAGLIPRPLTQAQLEVTPRGSYSVFFEHKRFTYVQGTSNNSNVGTTIEGGVLEGEDQSIVNEGVLPTEDLWNATKNYSHLKPMIAQGNSGEEHFIQYAYRSIWELVDGHPKVVNFTKAEIGRKVLRVWAAPTATFDLTSLPDNGIAFRQAPYFTCKINNIYPDGYVRILLTPVGTDNVIKVGGDIYSDSSTVATLEKTREFRSQNIKQRQNLNNALGNTSGDKKVADGIMRYDVVHYVDFDHDGVVDDTRIIASAEWQLDRSIQVKGSSINTSE